MPSKIKTFHQISK